MKKLEGKIIIVTGGSGLLGKAMLNHIQQEGGIGINADVQAENNLEKLTISCDITQMDSIQDILERIENHFGKVDGLVNNAYPRTTDWGKNNFEEMSMDSWRQNVDMQMNSYVAICQKIMPFFRKNKGGSIVNITSIYGVVGNDFSIYEGTNIISAAPYSAVKGGIINFTRYLASFYGKENIRVNCVSPGGIKDQQPEIFVKNYEHKVPLKRMGTPEDIAPSVSFLLSDEAKYITGHNLIVDGGWTCI